MKERAFSVKTRPKNREQQANRAAITISIKSAMGILRVDFGLMAQDRIISVATMVNPSKMTFAMSI